MKPRYANHCPYCELRYQISKYDIYWCGGPRPHAWMVYDGDGHFEAVDGPRAFYHKYGLIDFGDKWRKYKR